MGRQHVDDFGDKLYANCSVFTYIRDRRRYEDSKARSYTLYSRRTGKSFVSFVAQRLPGCCGVLVIYYLRPVNIKNAAAVFKDTLKQIVKAAGQAKYGAVLLTQTHASCGFTALTAVESVLNFTNWRTGNRICTYLINTDAPKERPKAPVFDGE